MNNKKKILLLSDDMRMTSGIARMSREFVLGTVDKYNWVQIAGAIKHPENGKKIDIKGDSQFQLPEDASITLYPTDGYGNPDLLRAILKIEKPDAILHFTDPRFWVWLYQMEHEIRTNIPIFYYNIWDDLPDPDYNTNYYRSSDLLMSISKQTYGINKRILSKYNYEDWQTTYVPHGISTKRFFKINRDNSNLTIFKSRFNLSDYKFVLLYNNRNIRRKMMGDVIMSYKYFMDSLSEDQRKECVLLFHTRAVDENGTDLPAVHNKICPDYKVLFTDVTLNDEEMNYLYNVSDVYINIASNEGFGLGSAEALMTKTPIIVNVTGGLQDQCGFKKEDGSYLTAEDYVELGSNHRGKYKEHGEWVKPVFPSSISLQGSPMTPYIFDDRISSDDVALCIRYWYDKTPEEREKCGESGYEYVMDSKIGMSDISMSNRFIESMESAFENWKPKEKYILEAV
tara:strand:+ start:806 stop:2170 length:1365 start_codon:yes stop_codon:yes gene_type:complete